MSVSRFELDTVCSVFERVCGVEAAQIARAAFTHPSPENVEAYMRVCWPEYAANRLPEEVAARVIGNDAVKLSFTRPGGEGQMMDLADELPRIVCPTLVLAGEDDPIAPATLAREMAARIGSHAELHVFPGLRHGIPSEDPNLGLPLIRRFITDVWNKTKTLRRSRQCQPEKRMPFRLPLRSRQQSRTGASPHG